MPFILQLKKLEIYGHWELPKKGLHLNSLPTVKFIYCCFLDWESRKLLLRFKSCKPTLAKNMSKYGQTANTIFLSRNREKQKQFFCSFVRLFVCSFVRLPVYFSTHSFIFSQLVLFNTFPHVAKIRKHPQFTHIEKNVTTKSNKKAVQ